MSKGPPYEGHPLALVFPPMRGEEYREFRNSIKEHGQLEPILLDEKCRIIDGLNRQQACLELEIEPEYQFRDFDSDAELADFIWSKNVSRRHLNAGQRAAIYCSFQSRIEELRRSAKAREDAARRRKVGVPKLAPPARERTRHVVAKEAGVATGTAQKALAVAGADAEALARVTRGELSLNAAYQRVQRDKAIAAINEGSKPLPEGQYRCIVADPSWAYKRTEASHRGSIDYPPMTTKEIVALPVRELAAEDSVLWLWTTNAFILRETSQVIDAWGFVDKTILTWAKPGLGTGDWLQNRTEHCVLAVRGSPVLTAVAQATGTLLEAPKREHSRKPDAFYELVAKLCPGPRIDLFAREKREGWDAWGAEIGKFASGGGSL